MNPETGEVQNTLNLKSREPYIHIWVSDEITVYIKTIEEPQQKPKFSYVAINNKNGQEIWEFNPERIRPLRLINGVLYFGDRTRGLHIWLQNNLQAFRLYALAEESMLSQEAIAIDLKTGNVLWRIKLIGEGKPLIEKLIVQDDMVFIKSLNG